MQPADGAFWTGWRGTRRTARVDALPDRLPERAVFDWRVPLPSEGLGGIAATRNIVLVGCRDESNTMDLFLCFDAETGRQKWSHIYLAPGELDYGESPRATPLIHDGRVYVQGAFGDLHCLQLDTGALVWARHIVRDFGAKRPTWGVCGSPFIVAGRLIVQPGAPEASIVALNPATGAVVWKTAGRPSAYSSPVSAVFGGRKQIVGYDQTSLGGWDPASGKRLWELRPPEEGDFNVSTPVVVGDKLFVATENNGARLYRFHDDGTIDPEPVGTFAEFAPDMHTPVAIGARVFGVYRDIYCLDATQSLDLRWRGLDDAFDQYASIIGSSKRLLITSQEGELLLVATDPTRFELLDRLALGGPDEQVLSHPALVDNHFYIRLGRTLARTTLALER